MNCNPITSILRYAERVRSERRRHRTTGDQPPLAEHLEIIDGGQRVRNRSTTEPITCTLVVGDRTPNAAGFRGIRPDVVVTLPPSGPHGAGVELPAGKIALAILPAGATFDDAMRALSKLGFESSPD